MMWLLVGWFAMYPTERMSLGVFPTQVACDERVMWLSESRNKKRDQRYFQCLEVPVVFTPEGEQ